MHEKNDRPAQGDAGLPVDPGDLVRPYLRKTFGKGLNGVLPEGVRAERLRQADRFPRCWAIVFGREPDGRPQAFVVLERGPKFWMARSFGFGPKVRDGRTFKIPV